MQYTFQSKANAAELSTDCVIAGVYQDGELSTAAEQLDSASGGKISAFVELGDFSGKKNETYMHYQLDGVKASRLLLVGLGKKSELKAAGISQASTAAAKQLKSANISSAASFLSDEYVADSAAAARQSIQAVAETFYSFNEFKSKKEDKASTLQSWTVAHTGADDLNAAVAQGTAIAGGMHLCRDLANAPGNVCTPTYLAETAKDLAQSKKVKLEVLEESDMEALGMGSFLSVSKGSTEPGKLIVLHYSGGAKGDAPVALVGKGITFDTGGISLKPGGKMDEMKFDMCGAASVLGSLRAAIDMDLPLNLVVVVAAAENMPAGNASKPGDIVTTMSGQTVEILNTDAEGRLVLCDALTYVEKFKPAAVVDVATLTGACIVALGNHISGMMSNDDDFAAEVLAAGESANDETWRLPLGDKYQEQLKSNFADMANIGTPGAGTITAGCFLARFTENMTWAHLDIAGIAWKGGAAKGATGRPVPLLTQLLLKRAGLV